MFEATGPVGVLLGVEALVARAGIAVAVQASIEAEASGEIAEETMAATPVEAVALAEVEAGIAAGLAGIAVARDEPGVVAGQVAVVGVSAAVPVVVAAAEPDEPAAAVVERAVSQAGPDELEAVQAGCRDALVLFRAGWAESPVGRVLFQVVRDGQAVPEAGYWVQPDESPVALGETQV